MLVVLGHIYDPAEPQWTTIGRFLIYAFHMPFFMYLSGYIFVVSRASQVSSNFASYAWKRSQRLLLPFLAMAIIIISAKYCAGRYLSVNKPVTNYLGSFYYVFFETERSPVLTIWYLFVLFVFSVFTPILHNLLRLSWPVLFAIGLASYAYYVVQFYNGRMTDAFYVDRVFMYYVFFIAGCLAVTHASVWESFVDRSWPYMLALTAVLDVSMMGLEYRYIPVGLASMPALHGLVRSRFLRQSTFLEFLGRRALIIYLLNTLFIGTVRGVLGKFANPADHMALLVAISWPIALFGPIVIRRLLETFSLGKRLAVWLD